MFEVLVSPSHPVYLPEGSITNLPALQRETPVPLPSPSTQGTGIWGPLWYWSVSPMPLWRALDLTFSLQRRLWGKNRKGKVWLRCERREDSSCCVSSSSLRLYQYINTAGALINIFRGKPGCNCQESHVYPGFTHGLNLDFVGWTVGPLGTDGGAHILCRFKTKADGSIIASLPYRVEFATWQNVLR